MKRWAIGLLAVAMLGTACSSDDKSTSSKDGAKQPSSDSSKESTKGPDSTDDANEEPVGVPPGRKYVETTVTDGGITVSTVSTRADLVTGHDARLRLKYAGDIEQITTTVDEDDLQARWEASVNPIIGAQEGVYETLIDGLSDAEHTVTIGDGTDSVTIDLTVHSVSGPLFAGKHIEPWLCKNEILGAGPAVDDDCNTAPTIHWEYQTTDGTIEQYNTDSPPTNIAVDTVGGETLPLIARIERGVINRGVYEIATLDPTPEPINKRWDPSKWNGRLEYRFGGGCGTSYSSGTKFTKSLDFSALTAGYAVASNSLTTFQTSCNAWLSAETALMTREWFIDQYGTPSFTIGEGGSGGAIQQFQIAQNYPGIIDAVAASVPFPDAGTIAPGVVDCGLLIGYYETADGQKLTDEQRKAINGHAVAGTCATWAGSFLPAIYPSEGCDSAIPAEDIYDATSNPDGARCTFQDINVAIFGVDKETGFANRPVDNIGVQYGFDAFNEGTISFEEFANLNKFIGGYDIDGAIQPDRHSATEEQMKRIWAAGGATEHGALDDVPVILRNTYTDTLGDIHDRVRVFSLLDRFSTDGERSPNMKLWTAPPKGSLVQSLTGAVGGSTEMVIALDQWVTAASDSEATTKWTERLAAAMPSTADDQCILADGTKTTGPDIYSTDNPCTQEYVISEEPRMAAGGPRSGDILKCELKDIDAKDYTPELTSEQVGILEDIFPDGVCDWSKPSVGRVEPKGLWQNYLK